MDERRLGGFSRKLRDRILRMRFFVAALLLHAVVFLGLATKVVYDRFQPRPSLESGQLIVVDGVPRPPEPSIGPTLKEPRPNDPRGSPEPKVPGAGDIILGLRPQGPVLDDLVPQPPGAPGGGLRRGPSSPENQRHGHVTTADLRAVRDFRDLWFKDNLRGNTDIRSRVAEFTVCIGQTSAGGDSLAFVRFGEDGREIVGGSIPNLAEMISRFSKGRIKARVQGHVVPLASREIFEAKPPFIYLTGRSDFRLTDAEIINLRNYVLMGGCIWGDNALPGLRSRFDIAFRREMKRVIPDADKPFEPLPASHPVYNQGLGYFKIGSAPAGLNFSERPVEAVKIDGIEAILYTANGYGAMWQVTFDDTLQKVDNEVMQRPEKEFWEYRRIFYRNLSEESLMKSYRLGINIVAYLLMRYESKVRSVPDA